MSAEFFLKRSRVLANKLFPHSEQFFREKSVVWMAVLIEMFMYLAEWKGFQHLVSEDPEAIAAAIIIVVDIPEIYYG